LPLWTTVWQFIKKLKIELANDPKILLLGIYPEEMKSVCQKVYELLCSLKHYLPKKWNQIKCSSTDRWIKKM
jgi:hypothetical protein